MYKIKSLIIFSIIQLLTITSYCYAEDNKINSSITPTIEIQKKYSNEDILKLNSLLEQQDYIGFYNVFSKINVSSNQQIEYLNSKKSDGHTPLYWLMADYYAKQNNIPETHKWLYISVIMTQQDASLCSDTTSKYASQKLLRSFPAAPDLTRKSPEYVNPAMAEVVFFIQNLKTRTNPIWACNFGQQQLNPSANPLLPKSSWHAIRENVLNTYSNNFNK
jgi:hypothetical protein